MASPAPQASAAPVATKQLPDTSPSPTEAQPKDTSLSETPSPQPPPPPPISARQKNIEARLSADEWDVDAWMQLLQLASSQPWPQADILYKRLVDQFPPIARLWLARAEHCSRFKPEETVTIFEQGVKNASTSIELWRAYLNHLITSVSQAEAQGQPANINGIVPVFERAVEAAGLDLQATPLWNDYVDFLRSRAVLSDPQRRDALRLVFQRAVMIFTSFTANTRNRRRKAPLYAPSPPREYSYINLLVFSMHLIYFYLALLLSGALSSSFMSYSIHFQTFSITNPFFLYVRLVGSNSHAAT